MANSATVICRLTFVKRRIAVVIDFAGNNSADLTGFGKALRCIVHPGYLSCQLVQHIEALLLFF